MKMKALKFLMMKTFLLNADTDENLMETNLSYWA